MTSIRPQTTILKNLVHLFYGREAPLHHPFTAPACSVEDLQASPATALSRAYDMVLNGTELGGGSVRIHDRPMQEAVFAILGIDEAEASEKFGFLLDALKYGALRIKKRYRDRALAGGADRQRVRSGDQGQQQ